MSGVTDKMVTLLRESDAPYRCGYGLADLSAGDNPSSIHYAAPPKSDSP